MRPWDGSTYYGDFVVVEGYAIPGRAYPLKTSVGPSFAIFSQGDFVTVVCKTPDVERPTKIWYLLEEPAVYLPSENLVESNSNPPGAPPDC